MMLLICALLICTKEIKASFVQAPYYSIVFLTDMPHSLPFFLLLVICSLLGQSPHKMSAPGVLPFADHLVVFCVTQEKEEFCSPEGESILLHYHLHIPAW